MLGIRIRKGQQGRITKGHNETLGDEYVHYLDYCDGFKAVYLRPFISVVYFKCAQYIVCQL